MLRKIMPPVVSIIFFILAIGCTSKAPPLRPDTPLPEPARPEFQTPDSEKEPVFSSGALLVKSIDLQNIYPARLLNYSKGFCNTTLINMSDIRPIKNVRIQAFVPEFMPVPAEKIWPEIGPGEEISLTLPATFDRDRLYGNQQAKKTTVTMTISYENSNEASKNFEIDVYGRQAMNWKEPRSIMNFVTPTDAVIKDFTSSVLSRLDLTVSQPCMINILKASAVFTALSSIPIRYSTDPNPDYFEETLDYVQFPRETLERKTGDCDDTTVLFASCLESIGIPTRFVITQDHIFLEFNTGMSEKVWSSIIFDRERFSGTDNSLWVPLEMTKLCQEDWCFYDAWSRAAELNKLLQNKDRLEIISFSEASRDYPSFPLPEAGLRQAIELNDLPARMAASMTAFYTKREEVSNRERERVEDIIRGTNSAEARNRLGILLCKSGLIKKAKEQFLAILSDDKNNAKAHQNLGNIYLINDDLTKAIEHYRKADEYGLNPEVLYNLGMAYVLMKEKIKAEESLRKAYGNLPDKEEKKKVAWMLGVYDLKYEKMSLSHPQLEAFKAIIYNIIPDTHLVKGSPALGSGASESSWKAGNLRPKVILGNFKEGVVWAVKKVNIFNVKALFLEPSKKSNMYVSEVLWWKF